MMGASMAKSIRSKWKRKMRAVKRERYAVKELIQLKKVLENDQGDVDMTTMYTGVCLKQYSLRMA
ncbi:protein LLP homolog isoform X3 [Tachypleus tridentatus]|uniref:protein LLP homolog isoform X3 n=1 Tax=Tachypleus tridentatus TaxID=6853 RepID=UPI003FD4E435